MIPCPWRQEARTKTFPCRGAEGGARVRGNFSFQFSIFFFFSCTELPARNSQHPQAESGRHACKSNATTSTERTQQKRASRRVIHNVPCKSSFPPRQTRAFLAFASNPHSYLLSLPPGEEGDAPGNRGRERPSFLPPPPPPADQPEPNNHGETPCADIEVEIDPRTRSTPLLARTGRGGSRQARQTERFVTVKYKATMGAGGGG